MVRIARAGLIAVVLAGVAATQDKVELFAQNTEEGVEIRAPRSPGKDQLWEAQVGKGKFWGNSHVSVYHKVENFSVDVIVGRLPGKQMNESWSPLEEIAKNEREKLTKPQGDQKEASYKEARVKEEDPKAKLPSLGRAHMQRLTLTDAKDGKREITQYISVSANVLYVVVVSYDAEGFKKFFAREGQAILSTIKQCKIVKKK
ncbi:MAG TPA: hypothetical protein VFS19_02950 [Planctomycetota bacterium]|nr:hypothetical protein [Planctomycetota bacterium]